jgi:predicted DNA-binding transcriptional regulator AlpA
MLLEVHMKATLPETGYLRLKQIIGDTTAEPPVPALIPVSRSTWLAGVKTGRYPQPVKSLGPRITAWRVEEIRAFIEQAAARPERAANV